MPGRGDARTARPHALKSIGLHIISHGCIQVIDIVLEIDTSLGVFPGGTGFRNVKQRPVHPPFKEMRGVRVLRLVKNSSGTINASIEGLELTTELGDCPS